MSSFTKPLILKFIDKKKDLFRFELYEVFSYYTDIIDYGRAFDIYKGFRTDFASVPRVLWSIIPPNGLYGKAAVVHDYLCETKIVSRKNADKIFLEAMKVLGVSWWKRNLMYRSVRAYSIAMRIK